MANFMIRFFICNVFISGIIGILLIIKRIFKNSLSSRMQYNLWFLLLGLLAVPFIPFRFIGLPQIFSWLGYLRSSPSSGTGTNIAGTAFLKSPIIVGLLKPCIYLPIHLISDYTSSRSANSEGVCITGYPNGCDESEMRYMLLHELQHYKHHDAIANYLMNLAVYWFNPLVWYALKEMRNDREVACDKSIAYSFSICCRPWWKHETDETENHQYCLI